jgi:4-alpha-glucanotransferase
MRDRELHRAAVHAGIAPEWIDAFGARRRVAADTLRALLDVVHADAAPPADAPPHLLIVDAQRPTLSVPARWCRGARSARIELEHGERREARVRSDAHGATLARVHALPPGYHHLEIGGLRLPLAAAPLRCFGVGDALGTPQPRAWGVAAQVYALRRDGDFGLGDFAALAQHARVAAAAGADALAISPLHALFAADASRYSPYAPSNRCFLNALHADAAALLPAHELDRIVHAAGVAADRATLRHARLIDWPRAARVHRAVFEELYRRFADGTLGGAAAFARFRADGGNALEQHALYEALDEHAHAGGTTDALPPAHSSQAQAFAHAGAARVGFHAFLQWRAACGIAAAQAAARDAGMGIGLIADLAVGVDPSGSECWSRPGTMLLGASIGAPPDQLNAIGQDWGLTTFAPGALAACGYAPFLDVLRATMRRAGGIRIDHVMGLMRLWLVPRGAHAADGAYLRYPFADLLRLVALESWRQRCIVIGEDLGTVPDHCRRRLAASGVLGLDVLAFMRAGDAFLAPRRWRADAVAMTSTHDLAPVAGWWRARDLDWRARLRLFGERSEDDERTARASARSQLARALARAGIARVSERTRPARIIDAAIDATARSPSPLALVPLEDLLALDEAPNLPGTTTEHPNWRRRYPAPAARLFGRNALRARTRRLARGRPKRR